MSIGVYRWGWGDESESVAFWGWRGGVVTEALHDYGAGILVHTTDINHIIVEDSIPRILKSI